MVPKKRPNALDQVVCPNSRLGAAAYLASRPLEEPSRHGSLVRYLAELSTGQGMLFTKIAMLSTNCVDRAGGADSEDSFLDRKDVLPQLPVFVDLPIYLASAVDDGSMVPAS